MTDKKCLFCRIVTKEIPAKIITENETVSVIQDIAPKAPVHYLILPKKHIRDMTSLHEDDFTFMTDLVLMAQNLSKNLLGSQAFRLVVNNGVDAGQSIFHLHWHFLSGKRMLDF